MSWILLTAIAQFLNAIVAIVDKYLVTDSKALPKPFVYAFYTCLITAAWLLVYLLSFVPGLDRFGIPQFSNVIFPTLEVIIISLLSAYTFFIAIVTLYQGLKKADTSNVMPVVGAVSAISTFGISWLVLGNLYPLHYVVGICLLALGTLLVSRMGFSAKLIPIVICSGVFFGLHYIAMKILFDTTNFDDGFFWSRIALILTALSLLFFPKFKKLIFGNSKNISQKTSFLVLGSKILAGVSAFMILKATDLGDVAVVQALDGLKFVFILLITVFLSGFLPNSVREKNNDKKTVIRKFMYVTIICIGFAILFI